MIENRRVKGRVERAPVKEALAPYDGRFETGHSRQRQPDKYAFVQDAGRFRPEAAQRQVEQLDGELGRTTVAQLRSKVDRLP